MDLTFKILFFICAFIIIWAMAGYQLSLKIIIKFYKKRKLKKDYQNQPSVTVMITAHNEEKVIQDKLRNVIELDYPREKIEFLVASDNSTDRTNEIVDNFIASHPEFNIRCYITKARMGKTNAQNEAQETISTDYIVMTDANSMLEKNAVRELMAAFTSDDIAYVTGRLAIVNQNASNVSGAEAGYWSKDLAIRDIESRIQTITAGNGALYACRNKDYHHFNPIQSHDTAMPLYYALKGKRAIANHDAVAYEKAGEVIEDEFKRKVRMNRSILKHILPDIRILNIFKYRWFTYFYFGHRTCRYLLWISHLLLLFSSGMLTGKSWFYAAAFAAQIVFFLLAAIGAVFTLKNKYINFIYYYAVTLIAQWVGVYKIVTGQVRPFWEKAESTR